MVRTHLSIDNNVAGLRELPGVVFELNIPQIMSVMSALVLSVLVGLAATWTNASKWERAEDCAWTVSEYGAYVWNVPLYGSMIRNRRPDL